jgi:catechol 2,3-dioxygenase-like lactoylglutathione lyase family enzyme
MAAAFKLSKIGLVMLGVSDLERSIGFYRDRLGLTLAMQFESFAFFEGGGVTLALSRGLVQGAGPIAGATEVVFAVEHVRAAFDALRGQGVEFVNEPRVVSPGNFAANFRDPDGHLLSVFGPE